MSEGTKDKPITEEDVARVLGECGADEAKQPAGKGEAPEAAPKPDPAQAAAAKPAPGQPEAHAESRIAKLEAEVATLKEQLLRELAEAENLRKRFTREREEQAKYAVAPLAKDLLPAVDNLRRALDSIPAEAIGADERLKGLMAGIEMTEKAVLDAFAKHNITVVDPKGEKMDPHRHEAMVEIPDHETPAGHISQVFEKGYLMLDRLLRPARVAVSKGGPPAAPGAGPQAAGPGQGNEPGTKFDTKV